jgi:hypothetical protein
MLRWRLQSFQLSSQSRLGLSFNEIIQLHHYALESPIRLPYVQSEAQGLYDFVLCCEDFLWFRRDALGVFGDRNAV